MKRNEQRAEGVFWKRESEKSVLRFLSGLLVAQSRVLFGGPLGHREPSIPLDALSRDHGVSFASVSNPIQLGAGI
jgi:hypothetical protein